jgi:hypothetical protein
MASPTEAAVVLRQTQARSPERLCLASCVGGRCEPSRWGDANESGGLLGLPPTGEVALLDLATPSLQRVHLSYLVDVRDSAKSGTGLKGSRRLNDLAKSTSRNVRGHPETDWPAVGQRNTGGVGAVVVVRGRESRSHGEGRQFVESTRAKVTDIPNVEECIHERRRNAEATQSEG